MCHRITFCIYSVLKHCAANRKRRLSALPALPVHIYTTLKFLALQETPYIYDISRLRVKVWAGVVVWLCDRRHLQGFPLSLSLLLVNMCHWQKERVVMDDGAAEHFSRSVSGILNITYHYERIGIAGVDAWPPGSPDPSRLGFYLWWTKSLVCPDTILNEKTLYSPNIDVCQNIRKRTNILRTSGI
jgi:hypothetical protein